MAVNLTGIDLSGAPSSTPLKVSTAQSAPEASPHNAHHSESVHITSTASLLAHLQQSLAAMPAVDGKRVDALSKAIEAGTYSVDSNRIATGLIQAERGLRPLNLAEI